MSGARDNVNEDTEGLAKDVQGEEEDHNDVTSSSTCSSIDEIKAPQIRAQFEKLAQVSAIMYSF